MVKEIHQMAQSSDDLTREHKKEIEAIYERVRDGESIQPDDIRTLMNALEYAKEES